MSSKYYTIIVWILFFCLLFSFLLYNSYRYLDPDLGWHLQVGRRILAEKAVPGPNYYNYTLPDKNWVDHEWLMNAASYWLYRRFGYLALTAIFALIMVGTLAVLAVFTRKYIIGGREKVNTGLIIFWLLCGALAMAPNIGVRMQEIALPGVLSLLIVIHLYHRRKNWKILCWLPLIFWIWANLHGSFLIGFFIVFLSLAVDIIAVVGTKKCGKNGRIKYVNFLDAAGMAVFFLFSCAGAAATLLTPYGFKLFDLLKTYGSTYYLAHIQEWVPPYFFPPAYEQLLYCSLIAAALVLSLFFLNRKPEREINGRKIERNYLWPVVLTVVFLLLTFKSRRHFPLFFVASFPFIIKFSCRHLVVTGRPAWLSGNFLLKGYVLTGLFLAAIGLLAKTNFTDNPFTSPQYCRQYPCAAVQFLKTKEKYKNLNLLNNYGWGGFLIWIWPEKKLFIDGRLPQYPFAGHTLLEEYYEFFNKEKIAAKLNQYDIRLVLLDTERKYRPNRLEKYILGLNESDFKDGKNGLRQYLAGSSEWKLDYGDDVALVYSR